MSHGHKQYADSYRDDAGEDREDDELGYSYHHRRTASGTARLAARPDKPAAVSARTTSRARPVELPVEETSPPSSTSSDKPAPAPAQQQQPELNRPGSMLLQLIACGSTAAAAAGGGGGTGKRAEPRRSYGLVSRLSTYAGADEDEEDEDAVGGDLQGLGRRFGHLAVEDKEDEDVRRPGDKMDEFVVYAGQNSN